MRLFILLVIITLLSCAGNRTQWTAKSPSGDIIFRLSLNEKTDMGGSGTLTYSISSGKSVVIESSPLGIDRQDQSFSSDLRFLGTMQKFITDSYTLHNGKRSECEYKTNEATFSFANASGSQMDLVVRCFNDGVAFRYVFPDSNDTLTTITAEKTGFALSKGTAIMMPYDNPGQWWPAYENYYQSYDIGSSSPTESGWAFPAFFELRDSGHAILLSESGLNGTYCGTRLNRHAPDGLYTIRLPESADGEGFGRVYPMIQQPWRSSWKVIIIGNSPGAIVESSLITHVADSAAYPIREYIQPGCAAWSWWSDSNSPRDFAKQKTFIDLAVEMGWEYYLLDANWNHEPTEDLLEFVEYANDHGIGMLMWYNSGGPHNIVTEAPRDRLFEKGRRRQEFEWLQDIGVKGVKVDFWHSDKQDIIAYYVDLLKDADDCDLLVNFHGCTIPRGWHRTYPNLLTLESVRGAESYKFAAEYPEKAPWHNVNLAFTRNVIGPMDYTPVTFSDMDYPHITTNAHELALSVVFQSGIQHFADKPEGYKSQPQAVQEFLMDVPVTWDDIHVIDGSPQQFIVLARQKGDNWYIGGINGLEEEKEIAISYDFLDGDYAIEFLGDGNSPREFSIESSSTAGMQTVTMAPYGGFVMKLTPAQ